MPPRRRTDPAGPVAASVRREQAPPSVGDFRTLDLLPDWDYRQALT